MARRDASPDFAGALARGLGVIGAFQPGQPVMSLTAVATAAGLARPTACRVIAALNVTAHAAQTPVETLSGEYCRCCSRRLVRSARTGHVTSQRRTSPCHRVP